MEDNLVSQISSLLALQVSFKNPNFDTTIPSTDKKI